MLAALWVRGTIREANFFLVRRYQGRVVFRGDMIRDEQGSFAVFTEQSGSTSHMAAAKVFYTIARLPGCNGEHDDAIGAYTQILVRDALKLSGVGGDDFIETYMSLPRDPWPADPELRKTWESKADPVCILRRSLYGHTKAGLLWEKYCEKVMREAVFTPLPGWECLYVHKAEQLFMSIYVDDFNMSGKKENRESKPNVDKDKKIARSRASHLTEWQRLPRRRSEKCYQTRLRCEGRARMF